LIPIKAFAADFANPIPRHELRRGHRLRRDRSHISKVMVILAVIASVMHSPMLMQKVPRLADMT
jgi:hypothetical protein